MSIVEQTEQDYDVDTKFEEVKVQVSLIELDELKRKAKRCDIIDWWCSQPNNTITFETWVLGAIPKQVPEKVVMVEYMSKEA